MKTGKASGIEHYASSLILEDTTTVRHYFALEGEISDYTFTVNGAELEAVDLGCGIICVDIADIPAQNLDELCNLTVNDSYTISYSPLNYIKQTVDSDNTKLSALVKALYNYWYQAELYVK